MKLTLNKEQASVVLSTIIIGAATLIMLPGLLGYIAGLWRLALLIGIVLISAVCLAHLYARITISRQGKRNQP